VKATFAATSLDQKPVAAALIDFTEVQLIIEQRYAI
jgi:hypothetical protein